MFMLRLFFCTLVVYQNAKGILFFYLLLFSIVNIFYLANCQLSAQKGLKCPKLFGRFSQCGSNRGQSSGAVTLAHQHIRTSRVCDKPKGSIWSGSSVPRSHHQLCSNDCSPTRRQDRYHCANSNSDSKLGFLNLYFC